MRIHKDRTKREMGDAAYLFVDLGGADELGDVR